MVMKWVMMRVNVVEDKDKIQDELRKIGDKLLEQIREQICIHVLLCDIDAMDELVHLIQLHANHQLLDTLRKKGLSKEITELCDKAGRISEGGVLSEAKVGP